MHVLSFRPEVILYIYMASCISVLVFNILYIFADKYKGRALEKRSLSFVGEISAQIERLHEAGEPEAAHYKRLRNELKNPEKLWAFEYSVLTVMQQAPEEYTAEYLRSLRGVFLELAGVYRKRDTIEQAYFAYLIEKFRIDEGRESFDGIMDFLMDMITGKDVNARENAMRAFYAIGNESAILAIWRKLEDNEISHSRKLLADGLFSVQGDRKELAKLLFAHREEFGTTLFLPVMQFIRFFTGDFQQQFFTLLSGKNEDKEIQLEAIRYFRRYPYEPVREILQNYVRYQEYIDWEYAAMAASALASYPGEDTVFCLKEGLKAANWYVRLNCAEALIYGLGISRLRLFDVENGRDRYAREIIRYVLEKEQLRQPEMKEGRVNV